VTSVTLPSWSAADWPNGWLAAIGATTILPGLRLSWTDDRPARAVLHWDDDTDLAAKLADAIPSPEDASARGAELDKWRRRQVVNHDGDLVDDDGRRPVTPFMPGVPKGLGMAARAERCARQLAEDVGTERAVAAWLAGVGAVSRVQKANGLGFDHRRIRPGAKPMADVLIETLALCALHLFPLREPLGAEGREDLPAVQRGWSLSRPDGGIPTFWWPTWEPPIDCWAIDHLLDIFYAERDSASEWPGDLHSLGVRQVWRSERYRPLAQMDPTRGYAGVFAFEFGPPPDPVGVKEIAARLDVKAQTVETWRRRHTEGFRRFPHPDWAEIGGRPAWAWSTIWTWAASTGRLPIGRAAEGGRPAK